MSTAARWYRTGAVVLVGGLIIVGGALSSGGSEDVEVVERVEARTQEGNYVLSGSRVALHNLAGEVRVRSGSGSDVEISVQRGGADADALGIEVSEIDGAQTLRVVYPGDEVVYPRMGGGRSQIRVGPDGTLGRDGGRKITVRGSGSGLEAWADIIVSVPRGKDVQVYVGVGALEASGVEADLLLDTSSGHVTASGIRGELEIDTGSGAVDARDVVGGLSIDTGSGSVEVAGVEGDVVSIDTGSGHVSGRDVRTARFEIDTGSGGVELTGVEADDVLIDTGSGGVEVALLRDVRSLVIDTGSGGVTLTAPADLGAEFEIETGSGAIDFGFPVNVTTAERSHVIGTIGDGAGRISIDTGSGSVRVRRP